MKRLLMGLLAILGTSFAQASSHQVDLEDVLLLAERGVSNETILVFLETRKIGFSPGADDINRLKAAGITEDVIRYLLRQTTVKSDTPPATDQKIVYVYPYPDYYYRPYYFESAFYLGYSYFPYAWYQPHHGVPIHHDAAPHTTHNVHNGNHGTLNALPTYNRNQNVSHNRNPNPNHVAGNTHKPRDELAHNKGHRNVSPNMPNWAVGQHNNNQRNRHMPSDSGRSHNTNHNPVGHSSGYSGGHSSWRGGGNHGRAH